MSTFAMSTVDTPSSSGFAERAQEPYASIPTDPDAFLRWASTRPREEGKYELSKGRVQHTMINVNRRHALIVTNITYEILRQIDRDRFFLAATDFAVRTSAGIRGPDIVVDDAKQDGSALSTDRPIFIAEVLSPSSIGRDFTEKLEEYTTIASLQTYLICSQDQPRLWQWQRQADGTWPKFPLELSGRDGAIQLEALGVELALEAIFRGIPDGAG